MTEWVTELRPATKNSYFRKLGRAEMTVSRDRVIRVFDAWPVLGVGISTCACSSCCAGVRLDRDAAERSTCVSGYS
jgi:hypothetical protein